LLYLTEVLCEAEDESVFEDLPSVMRRGKAERCLGLSLEEFDQIGDNLSGARMAG
jgi:hypothetical protein